MGNFYKLIGICTLMTVLVVPAYANTVTDRSGRTFEVRKPFQRIISLYGAHTENLFHLGLNKEIIGVSKSDTYPPEALKKSKFSYHDDAEKFMAFTPDLVLIRPMIARVYRQFIEKLEQAGITVISLQPVGIEDMYRYWRDLGVLTGRETEADTMIRTFRESVQTVRERTMAVPPENRKKVYFESIHNKMKTFSQNSMAMFVLETAGGINVAKDASQMRQTNIAAYGKERVLSKAREIDVYLAQYGSMNAVTVGQIRAEPGFQVIRAIRDSQVYLIDEMIVSRATFRLLEAIEQINRILYPDIAPGR
ncbi:ABC transporter substrate-binding protein [Desulfonema ishimotonii]|uniref:ABC transporter substrate-binding protein n=1 Tax=Desulfonema ishimotonii TaxID=45657 RepID=A0A401FUT8_9BACT|nr:ABC transporter substrate-binding protein [Desulfonema ishimotonii]GBC60726.1 ABC transporter substrate-binding protein [Desulfonema ishimotonii]